MKMNRWFLPALVAVLAVAGGCKKEDNTNLKSLDGSLSLSMPTFVRPGDSKTFMIDTLMTQSCPEGYTVGYYFTDPLTSKRDTVVAVDGTVRKRYYTFTVGEELSTQSLTLTTFTPKDSGYSGSSAKATFTVVSPGLDGKGSITGFDNESSAGTFKDARDGKSYAFVHIGALDWMRHNLAWTGSGCSYWNAPEMADVFGQYYTWEQAQTACPEGWRLPTDADWTALKEGAEAGKDIPGLAGDLMANLYFNGIRMWEYWREVTVTDKLHFSAMPVGYVNVGNGTHGFNGLYSYAAFWTSDQDGDLAVARYLYEAQDVVYRGSMSKTDFGASVRCVR